MASSAVILLLLFLASPIFTYPLDTYREVDRSGSSNLPEADSSGPSIQDRFKDFYDKVSDNAKEVWDDAKGAFKSANEKVKGFIDHTKDKAKETIQDVKEEVQLFVEKAKDRLEDLLKTGQGHVKEVYDNVKEKGLNSREGRTLLDSLVQLFRKGPTDEIPSEATNEEDWESMPLKDEPSPSAMGNQGDKKQEPSPGRSSKKYVREAKMERSTDDILDDQIANIFNQGKKDASIDDRKDETLDANDDVIFNDEDDDESFYGEKPVLLDNSDALNKEEDNAALQQILEDNEENKEYEDNSSKIPKTSPLLPWDGDNADSWSLTQQLEGGNDKPYWRPKY